MRVHRTKEIYVSRSHNTNRMMSQIECVRHLEKARRVNEVNKKKLSFQIPVEDVWSPSPPPSIHRESEFEVC